MGMDHVLVGQPGPNYCVLACEQWNSPLYCDSEHPQDKEVTRMHARRARARMHACLGGATPCSVHFEFVPAEAPPPLGNHALWPGP